VIRLVVTADDFGAAYEINDAVESAHRSGMLTAASLMIAAPFADEAVRRARSMPQLGVGLHVVLIDGRPILPPGRIPDLVDRAGRFRANMPLVGARIAFDRSVRSQVRAEVEAQFAAFAETGLAFDHVNAHKHFHVHPVIREIVLDAAARHGVRAIRSPITDASFADRLSLTAPFARALRDRARQRGFVTPDRVYGLAESGTMDVDRLRSAISRLEPGLNEIYLHPATRNDFAGSTPKYRHRAELDGLLDERTRDHLVSRQVSLGSFESLSEEGGP
jgi:hopanoid biosynthesis associated protein HpnK